MNAPHQETIAHNEPPSIGTAGRGSIGLRLFAVFTAVFLIPLFVSNVWGYARTRSLHTELEFRNVSNVAEMKAANTLEFVRERRDRTAAIAEDDSALFGLLSSLHRVQSEARRAELQQSLDTHLVSLAAAGEGVEEFRIVPDAGACFSAGGTPDHSYGFEHHGDEPTLIVSSVIEDQSGGEIGALCAKYVFDVHRELVAAHTERTAEAAIYLLDEQGRVVCSSFEHADDAHYGEQLDRPESHGGGANSVATHDAELHGRTGGYDRETYPLAERYTLETGEDVIAAYAPIEDLGWGILVEAPLSSALYQLERIGTQVFLVSGALSAVLLFVIFLTTGKLGGQLRTLADTATRIAGGALGERVSTEGPSEVAELGMAFNQMSVSLRDSHQLLSLRQRFTELLLDSIDQRVLVVDREYRITKANRTARELHGEDIVGRPCCDVFEYRGGPDDRCPIRNTLETGEPASVERVQRTLRKEKQIFAIETYPVRQPGERVESVIQIAREVSHEKQLQVRMAHHEKMAAFGLVAAGMAHDIGNPLASIEAQLRLGRQSGDSGGMAETMSAVEREVARLGRMLRELVQFSRRKRDEVVLLSVNQVIQDAVRLLCHDPRAHNVHIETEIDENLPGIRAREDDLMQVLVNLGLNAVDAMPDGGTLRFRSSREAGDVVLRVEDTGVGVDPDQREHLFEPFVSTKPRGKGTGLGLFVSLGIVEALGGGLTIERTGSQGTVFAARFPIRAATREGGHDE